jgi:hypothetical protein
MDKTLGIVISGLVSFGIVLILGAYSYIWSEVKSGEQEKHEWRQEHERVLDRRFSEIRQGQEKLQRDIERNTSSVEFLLQKILEEQRRVSDELKLRNKSTNKFR